MKIQVRNWFAVLSVFAFVLSTGAAFAAVDPVAKCESSKLKAVGKYAKGAFGCESKAAKKGLDVDPACENKAKEKLEKTFAKADETGCDGAESLARVLIKSTQGAIVEAVGSEASGPDACLGAKSKAAGKYMGSVLTAEAKHVTKPDPVALNAKRDKAVAKLIKSFVKADEKSDCAVQGNVSNVRGDEDAAVESLLGCITAGVVCDSNASDAVGAGGSLTTDTEADGATIADPVETTVTSPNAGEVLIGEFAPGADSDAVLTVLGRKISIQAPVATAADPLVIVFAIESTLLTDGTSALDVDVLRNGSPVGDCSGAPGAAAPDPCVESRTTNGFGNAEVTVLSSKASVWTPLAALPVCSDTVVMLWETVADRPGRPTATSHSIGWNGLGHDLDPVDGFATAIGLWCHPFPPFTAPDFCGLCDVTGVNPDTGNCRCANDNRQICDQPLEADQDDCGGNPCECYTSPPSPNGAAGAATCSLSRLQSDLSGQWLAGGGGSGWGVINFDERVRVYIGQSIEAPCPVCVGDPVPGDGVREGSCNGGANDLQDCDADGSASPAPFGDAGAPSLDCMPLTLSNVNGLGSRNSRKETIGGGFLPSPTMHATRPCDPPLGAFDCHCPDVCTGDNSVACNTNSDCSVVGAGTCQQNNNGASAFPNGCSNGTCDTSGATDGSGVCDTGPTDNFCDGFVDADGTGVLACLTNADCLEEVWGFAAGTCSTSEIRSCFGASLTPTGTADAVSPVTVSTYCMAPTNSSAINFSSGLPGPVLSYTEHRASYFTTDCADADGDGFGDEACGGVDCYDANDQAFPGQTGSFSVDRGDGSYDYDCDGDEDELLEICGNGVVTASEECDDGDISNGDFCTTSCQWAYCGDGHVCSDFAGADACQNSPLLGGTEQCDDGNNTNGDGCQADCTILQQCQPNCSGKVCGDDGCGGSCGACSSGEVCCANGTACCVS